MKPIILNFAESRIHDDVTFFKYDFIESLNVLKVANTNIAFIDMNSKEVSLLTETKAYNEGSDCIKDDLELSTVTRASREQDDNSDILLELKTKTLIDRERDDESIDYI